MELLKHSPDVRNSAEISFLVTIPRVEATYFGNFLHVKPETVVALRLQGRPEVANSMLDRDRLSQRFISAAGEVTEDNVTDSVRIALSQDEVQQTTESAKMWDEENGKMHSRVLSGAFKDARRLSRAPNLRSRFIARFWPQPNH